MAAAGAARNLRACASQLRVANALSSSKNTCTLDAALELLECSTSGRHLTTAATAARTSATQHQRLNPTLASMPLGRSQQQQRIPLSYSHPPLYRAVLVDAAGRLCWVARGCSGVWQAWLPSGQPSTRTCMWYYWLGSGSRGSAACCLGRHTPLPPNPLRLLRHRDHPHAVRTSRRRLPAVRSTVWLQAVRTRGAATLPPVSARYGTSVRWRGKGLQGLLRTTQQCPAVGCHMRAVLHCSWLGLTCHLVCLPHAGRTTRRGRSLRCAMLAMQGYSGRMFARVPALVWYGSAPRRTVAELD